MEFFNKAKAVRLRSHLDKFLVADDDEETVRQSRNGSSKKARWMVELVVNNPHVIRLRSCHGRYLTATDEPFLLGMTGKKVLQTVRDLKMDATVEWEPIKEGFKVKLRTKGGKFLRANGATLPWRNSITHDLPYRTATQDWVLWEVDLVDVSVLDGQYLSSNNSSFSSIQEDYSSCPNSPLAQVRTRDFGTVNSLLRSSLQSRLSISSDRSPRYSRRREGMEFFSKAKTVRLQSHLGKYLVADDDEQSVHQSRDGASRNARWAVECVEGKSNQIRLKSCHGLYLTAADEPYLLGMTGKKVRQTLPEKNVSVEWEPVKDGLHLKLMTSDGKFLRGNGGSPPWRNTVTHDVPQRTATQSWVLWSVDVLEIGNSDLDSNSNIDPDLDPDSGHLSPQSSYSPAVDDYAGSPEGQSPVRRLSAEAGNISMNKVSAMNMFKKAKSIRLKGYHDKFLAADANEETVFQDRSSTGASTKWTVEFVEGVENVIRLRSCYGKYLTATDDDFLKVGVSGRKVVQSLPKKLDSSVQWEPLRDGVLVKLKTRYGNYLRANGGLPPWRNSITHDIPSVHHEWVLWEVMVVEARCESDHEVRREDEFEASFHLRTPSYVSNSSFEDSPKRSEGRLIYYHIANDEGEVDDAYEGLSFQFKGQGVAELKQKLEEETGLENITVCSRNIVNDKLYPLRLSLPPNNATMNVVVVPPTSRAVHNFP